MVDEVVAILDDSDERAEAMRHHVAQRFPRSSCVILDNAPDMITWLKRGLKSVSLMSLDHDLGASRERNGRTFDPGTGRDVVDFLTGEEAVCPVIIHTSNTFGGDGMQYELEAAGWTVRRILPFGASWIEDERCAIVGELMQSP